MSNNDQQRRGPTRGYDSSAQVQVLEAKVEMLITALAEIKDQVRTIADTVNILRMLDVQMKQQGEDQKRFLKSLEDMQARLVKSEESITATLNDSIRELGEELAAIKSRVDTVDGDLKDRVSFIKGASWVFSLLGVALYGLLLFMAKGYIENGEKSSEFIQKLQNLKIEENIDYIHRMRVLELEGHLRPSSTQTGEPKVVPPVLDLNAAKLRRMQGGESQRNGPTVRDSL